MTVNKQKAWVILELGPPLKVYGPFDRESAEEVMTNGIETGDSFYMLVQGDLFSKESYGTP